MTSKEKRLIIPLYKAIIRPHLEYCIQAWRPYEKRLKQCGLTTLETRRLRGNYIEVSKILNG